MFKVLAFQSLCLASSKIDCVLSWQKCIYNSLSTNQSHKLAKSLSSCFPVSLIFYVGDLCKYHHHKVTNH